MTPKEKAEELYNNMLEKMPHPDVTNANVYSIVKQCALISVEHIIDSEPQYKWSKEYEPTGFWGQVKKEIEAL